MYFCPKCNFLLDITKNIQNQNNKQINSIEEFIERSLNNDLSNINKLKFSINDLVKDNNFKKLGNDQQKILKNKYNLYCKNNSFVNAYFFCDNCNFNTKLEPGTIIFKTSTSDNFEEDNDILVSRVLDKTLPRTKDFICPNQKCETNKNFNDKNREAVFYRPESNNFNLKYVCCVCKLSWSPYFTTNIAK